MHHFQRFEIHGSWPCSCAWMAWNEQMQRQASPPRNPAEPRRRWLASSGFFVAQGRGCGVVHGSPVVLCFSCFVADTVDFNSGEISNVVVTVG